MNKVIVVGGGPSGATAAGIMAKAGVEVTLLDRERFPRHHVGESLQPGSMALLDHHFGLGPTIAAQGFAYKFGAVYTWGQTREPWAVLFDRRLDAGLPATEAELLAGDYEHAWQVDRERFDALLLQAAKDAGAHVREGVEVSAPLLDEAGRVTGVRTRDGEELRADFVLDASGQRCLLGRTFKLNVPLEDIQSTSAYTYYDGAGGLPGPLGRHVQQVVTIADGWVWFIPISATRTSVGVVTRDREKMSQQRFDALVAEAGFPLDGATQVAPLRHVRDWSYTHTRLVGPGWMLVGDAACFVDPILSGGVDAAIRSAADAALTLLAVRDGEAEAEALAAYARNTDRLARAYLRLVRYWYGNNRSVEGMFWEAHQEISEEGLSTPLRAFVYLTSGRYASDRHLRVYQAWQERQMFDALGVDERRVAAAVKRHQRAKAGAPEPPAPEPPAPEPPAPEPPAPTPLTGAEA